ncbi:MAG: hypothetical protein QG588_18 [Candidatus Poribacteria bacterium]|nr:hypothetical protein [Candidatus Poribacteria bacterium]
MTEIQIQLYLNQLQWVVTIIRIKQYLKSVFGIKEELDEDETVESHEAKELEELKKQAILHGIPPPIK